MIAALCLLTAAHATPGMPGDPLQAAPASQDTVSTPALQAPAGLTTSAQLSHARGLVVFETFSGEQESVLDGATGMQLGAVWGAARADFGVTLPAYLQLSGDQLAPAGGAVGDLGLHARAPLAPWLSAQLSGTAPTGDDRRLAGYGGFTGAVGLIAGTDLVRLRAAYQLPPPVDLGDVVFDDVVRLSAALTPALGDRWRLSGEADVQLRRQAAALSTGELLFGGHRAFAWGSLYVGGGVGMLAGPGTPKWRLLVGARRTAR